ncbi:MAG: enoyl-CoA hydratase [Trueperaceae bacterium]|nr:enoyl-CoA hydratase [Trueperaceae bacterium]
MSEHILVSQENRILKLQLNRPEKKNALTAEMYSKLAEELEQANTDPQTRVILLTGSGDSFSSGNDLNDFLQNPPQDGSSPVFRFLKAISTCEKPIVAAVNGIAIGIGTTMLLHCDLVYASETALFQLPFVNLALVPEAAASYLLPQKLGYQKAAELIYLSKKFGAAEAKELGLVNDSFTADALQDNGLRVATELSQKAPEALRLSKMLLKRGAAQVVAETMQTEGELFRQRLGSPEAQEVMQAFMQKRQPDFSKFS